MVSMKLGKLQMLSLLEPLETERVTEPGFEPSSAILKSLLRPGECTLQAPWRGDSGECTFSLYFLEELFHSSMLSCSKPYIGIWGEQTVMSSLGREREARPREGQNSCTVHWNKKIPRLCSYAHRDLSRKHLTSVSQFFYNSLNNVNCRKH